ncbi:hypothetical protein FACS1894190_11370 [Spirochaetia bacterium]|nr:hypothetical protein FACS1894190_11370 [Spirochaetia bacterium]
MDVVYLFYTRGTVGIPVIGFDKQLITRLKCLKSGYWDERRRSFVLPADYITNAVRAKLLCGMINVQVNKDNENPVTVHGFLDKPWPIDTNDTNDTNEINDADYQNSFLDCSLLEILETEMRSRKYSYDTIKSYLHYNKNLCETIKKSPENIISTDIKYYLETLERKGFSSASMNLAISALKFFYGTVLKKHCVNEQKRPREDKRLPIVLAKSEILAMIKSLKNPKHRVLLTLAYSSGLRVGELVKLRKENIDFIRKTIYLHDAKGRKDRYTILSETAEKAIKGYCQMYSIEEGWLFPSWTDDKHLTIRTAQKVFDAALEKTGIKKEASIHSLRHSFATHLLETGTDISFIKDLLGHNSIRTTERYAHIAKRKVLLVQSPLDNPLGD